jgi:hypothetical protein
MSMPTFGSADRAQDVVDGVGRWLATELGWRWVKGRRDVETRIGSGTVQLSLASSGWSQGRAAFWITAGVSVLDNALARWRVAEPDLTIFSPLELPKLPIAYSSLLKDIERDLSQFEASGLPQNSSGPEALSLGAFYEGFRSRVKPVLDLFESPARVARGLPASWRRMVNASTVEWALARGDRDAARAILRMCPSGMSMLAGFQEGWRLAPHRDPRSKLLAWKAESLGWLARVHDLVDISELPPLDAPERVAPTPK